MKTDVLVLGAGMIGICTALQLARRGHSVCLLDRQPPGRETSYGNAGIVQSEAMLPYAFPRDWATLTQVALRRSTAVHFQFAALPGLAAPLARYWWASAPRRYETAVAGHSALIAHAAAAHRELMTESDAESLVRHEGYRWVFRTARALDAGRKTARSLDERFGVRHVALDGEALARAEPALQAPLAGAIHWPDPATAVDPGALVAAYASRYRDIGGTLLQGDAGTLEQSGEGWRARSVDGMVEARHAVVALGPWSAALVTRLGYRLPLFVKRGYHRHFSTAAQLEAPLLDAERGFVLAPMSAGIRLTTGVEFARLGAPATDVQMTRATRAARELLSLPTPVEAQPWLGNRPCTADMLPVLGAAPRHRGLWFNFGHAHQGFTLGPVCGRLISELIEERPALVDMSPYAAARFGA